MRRNRFHRFRRSLALFMLAACFVGSVSVANAATPTAPTVNTTQVILTFAPGSTKLTSEAKSKLTAILSDLQAGGNISAVGYSSVATKKANVAKDALARATGVQAFLRRLGLSITVTTKSGGYPSRYLKAAVANRVVLSYSVNNPNLLWVENFNQSKGSAPNPAIFSALTGNGCQELGLCNYGTGEIEYNDPSAAFTDGSGNLVIHSEKQSGSWVSARIWTAQKLAFQYGTLEIRAKLPAGNFNWPAIWMLGDNYQPPNQSFGTTQWPASGELDIAEGLAQNSVVQGTIHGLDIAGGPWRGGGGLTALALQGDVSSTFHTWGISWQPNLIIFTMDGVEYCRDTFDGTMILQRFANNSQQVFNTQAAWPFNQPLFLILNNAIWAGASAPDGAKSDFLIDSIRYSKFNGYGALTRH